MFEYFIDEIKLDHKYFFLTNKNSFFKLSKKDGIKKLEKIKKNGKKILLSETLAIENKKILIYCIVDSKKDFKFSVEKRFLEDSLN